MIGRHFLIACAKCEKQKSVEADSLDEVVSQWNKLHDPSKKTKGLGETFREWTDTLKGYVEYQRDRFRQGRERKDRLRRTILEIQHAQEREDAMDAPMDLVGAEPETER
jgi:hypothetical protein